MPMRMVPGPTLGDLLVVLILLAVLYWMVKEYINA